MRSRRVCDSARIALAVRDLALVVRVRLVEVGAQPLDLGVGLVRIELRGRDRRGPCSHRSPRRRRRLTRPARPRRARTRSGPEATPPGARHRRRTPVGAAARHRGRATEGTHALGHRRRTAGRHRWRTERTAALESRADHPAAPASRSGPPAAHARWATVRWSPGIGGPPHSPDAPPYAAAPPKPPPRPPPNMLPPAGGDICGIGAISGALFGAGRCSTACRREDRPSAAV